MYRKKTLRHMQPLTRRYARLINDLDSALRRLTNFTTDLARLELDSRALFETQHPKRNDGDPPTNLDEFMSDYHNEQEADDEL